MSVTAAEVLAEAKSRHGEDLDAELLGQTYESMIATAERDAGGIYYTPKPVASFMTTFALGTHEPSWLGRLEVTVTSAS